MAERTVTDCLDRIRFFIGEIEADLDILQGRTKTFGSAKELIEDLNAPDSTAWPVTTTRRFDPQTGVTTDSYSVGSVMSSGGD